MIDHIGIHVSNIANSKAFYIAALASLGYKVITEIPEWNVFGLGVEQSDVWIAQTEGVRKGNSVHVAFSAKTHEEVDAFYEDAIAAGGEDNGKPGIREEYSPTYYAAFVFDPDGNNIEVVCRV